MNDKKRRFPIIEDLPVDEKEEFENYLAGSQMPINEDGTQGYYQRDYEAWKRRLQYRVCND
ncbi:MAG: hypothetical protein V7735_23460 [Photobacterium frigidiphilum]|uniref:hypothetical protein n=1 Tax=Photobacterium frigidiphilum TaxID=264736 RepID=UPI0030036AB2